MELIYFIKVSGQFTLFLVGIPVARKVGISSYCIRVETGVIYRNENLKIHEGVHIMSDSVHTVCSMCGWHDLFFQNLVTKKNI